MSGKLILTLNDEVVGEYELAPEPLVIGRRSESGIHIDALAVSGRHAEVKLEGTKAVVEDLKSTNGTLVNGKRIEKHELADGDVIAVGRHNLRFVADKPEPEPAAEEPSAGGGEAGFAETIVISPDDAAAMRQAASEGEVAAAREADIASGGSGGGEETPAGVSANIGRARLRLITEGKGDPKEMPLSKALTTIGKPGVQVAAISRRQNGDFILHIDGGAHDASRPVVNGVMIDVKSQKLADRDLIQIAGVKMQYLLGDN